VTAPRKIIPVAAASAPAAAHDEIRGCAEAEPYALRVIGDSMEPEFFDGHVVIVDPVMPAHSGAYVIVDHGGETLLRQVVRDAGRTLLRAVNQTYPSLELDRGDRVRGVVVQRAGRRRTDRKHYYGG